MPQLRDFSGKVYRTSRKNGPTSQNTCPFLVEGINIRSYEKGLILGRLLFSSAVLITALLAGLMYRSPASVISSGDELAAISWIMADNLGQGSWELYPMTFTITTGSGRTSSVISGCIPATPPGLRYPADFPPPVEFTCTGSTISIKFGEVPE